MPAPGSKPEIIERRCSRTDHACQHGSYNHSSGKRPLQLEGSKSQSDDSQHHEVEKIPAPRGYDQKKLKSEHDEEKSLRHTHPPLHCAESRKGKHDRKQP